MDVAEKSRMQQYAFIYVVVAKLNGGLLLLLRLGHVIKRSDGFLKKLRNMKFLCFVWIHTGRNPKWVTLHTVVEIWDRIG